MVSEATKRMNEIMGIKPAQQQASEPPWIEHDGSAACPVPAGHDVEVRYRQGVCERRQKPENWYWDWDGDLAITHYRDWTAWERQQASAGEVPEWARDKAHELIRKEIPPHGGKHYADVQLNAFARYIAATEPAPVDPLQAIVQRVACRLRQHGLYSDTKLADELERQVARVTVAKGGE